MDTGLETILTIRFLIDPMVLYSGIRIQRQQILRQARRRVTRLYLHDNFCVLTQNCVCFITCTSCLPYKILKTFKSVA